MVLDDKPRKTTALERKLLEQVKKNPLDGDVLFIGHSWIVGVTDYRKPKDLERRFEENGVRAKIDAVCEVSAHLNDVKSAMESVVKKRGEKKYKFVVFMIGGNDLASMPAKEIVKRIEGMYVLAKSLSTTVFVCNLHPYGPYQKKIEEINRLLAESAVIPHKNIIDAYTKMKSLGEYELHPKKGYCPVKDMIVKHVSGFIEETKMRTTRL